MPTMLKDSNDLTGSREVIEKARIIALSEKRVLQALIAIEHEGRPEADNSSPLSCRPTEE